MAFHVEPATWDVDRDALRHVRDVVFIQEQQVPVEEEWDELDPLCHHVLARSTAGEPIGTGRLTPEHKIGRMAVMPDWRGRGVGAAMLQSLIERARELGWKEASLHAQVDAIGFYERFGFQAHGEEFMEAGIRHRHMSLALAALTRPPTDRGVILPRPEAVPLQTDHVDSMREAVVQLLADSRRALSILHPELDPRVFDHDALLQPMRALAARRRASIRCLVHNAERLLANGHRIVDLTQRLPSAVQVRVVTDDEYLAYPSAFVLNDVGGYLLQPHVSRPGARGSTCAPGEHARLEKLFDTIWERSIPAAVLRPLSL